MSAEEEITKIFKAILRKAGIKFTHINWVDANKIGRKYSYAHANICIGRNCFAGVNLSSTLKMWRSIRPCNFMIDLREPDSFKRAVRTLKNCFGKANKEDQHTDHECGDCEFKPRCMICDSTINYRNGYTNCEECGNKWSCKDFDYCTNHEYSGHIPYVHWTCGKCRGDSCWEE